MAATTPASDSWSSPPRRQHHGGGVSRSKKGREYDRAWYDDEEGGAAHSSYLGVTDESNEKRWAEKEERYVLSLLVSSMGETVWGGIWFV